MTRITILALSFALAVVSPGTAQDVSDQRGSTVLTEGYRYMVGFPQVWAESTEKPTPQPMQLMISSRTTARVRVVTAAVITDVVRIDNEYVVEPNKPLRIPISTAYMNVASEQRSGLGIQITSDQPISVSTYQAWLGNGEATRHLPVEGWGTEYYSMNFFNDRFGASRSTMRYRPSQILIIADHDSTMVSYTPTVNTEGGIETRSVRKGETKTIRMQRGETYLIKAAIDTPLVKDVASDMSGTRITSNYPIGVVSGHTKGAIMRFPDMIPPFGMPMPAHFVRNNLHDAMHPVELAGTKFVTVPCMYTANRVVGQDAEDFGYDDDRGDVIRVIATEDNTTVRISRRDGGAMMSKFVIAKRGETRLELSLDYAAYWESNKPILMAQYGKSYARIIPPGIDAPSADGKHNEAAQGHPTVESGMPMLQTVPPVDRWVDDAAFYAPEGMNSFVNVVCREADLDQIDLDGRTLRDRYGALARRVAATEYTQIRTPINAGWHRIQSRTSGVRWMAWSYGSLDGLQQGRAYGSPVAIDLSEPCADSIAVTDEFTCDAITGRASVVSADTTCGSMYAVVSTQLTNYTFRTDSAAVPRSRFIDYALTVNDVSKNASAVVRMISRSGTYLERTYTYTPGGAFISGATSVCVGQSYVYRVAVPMGETCTWSVSQHGTIVGSAMGDSVIVRWDSVMTDSSAHVIARFSTNSCQVAQLDLIAALPEARIRVNQGAGERLQAFPDDAQAYQWLGSDKRELAGETGSIMQRRVPGTYYVVVTKNGCRDTSDAYQFSPVSVDDQHTTASDMSRPHIVAIAPLPATSSITIDLVSHRQGHLDIMTLTGQTVVRHDVDANTRTLRIDTRTLTAGVYVVVVTTGTRSDQRLMVVVE